METSQGPEIEDLVRQLEQSVHPSNRIVERFLLGRVLAGHETGIASAEDIKVFMNRRSIVPAVDGYKNKVHWANGQIATAITNGLENFEIVEVEGFRKGVNFRWWMK